MGFLRRIFGGGKKHRPPPPLTDGSGQKSGKDKRSWSFVKQSMRDNKPNSNRFDPSSADSVDANKHAIAVAAATAAVAEAALAAAHAAAEVVRLTSGGSVGGRPATAAEVRRQMAEESAAVKIQSAFRGYLARRALRALKALVKLQALVRGHIVRKKTADMLKRMQTLVRLQARARATRVHSSENMPSFNSSSLSHYPVPEDYNQLQFRAYSTKFEGSSILKRCCSNSNFRHIDLERGRVGSSWMEESGWSQIGNKNASLKKNVHLDDDEKSDKILEVDTWKPHFNKAPQHSSAYCNYNENLIMAYKSPSKRSSSKALINPRTAENSPQAFSASSSSTRLGIGARRGPFTPTKSECSWGFFNGYSGHPNYMANTESSRAKVRSNSAPRQRLQFDRYGSTRRSIQGLWDAEPSPLPT